MLRIAVLLMLVVVAGYCSDVPVEPEQQKKPWSQHGSASWYGKKFHGKLMANQKRFNQYALTCAHMFLPLGTNIWVETPVGRRIKVQVTDRGPFKANRILDLSYQAAKVLGITHQGVSRVTITLCSDS